MKKLAFSILLSTFAAVGMAQVFQYNTVPFKFRGLKGDSLVVIPSGVDTPFMSNPKWGESINGALFLRTGDSSLWGKIGSRWRRITGAGGGGSTGLFGNDTATLVIAKVHNNAGVTLVNGDVVYMNNGGNNSDAPSVRKAVNKGDSTSANTFGFVTGSIAVNDTGYIILSGKIEKLNTSAFNNGDIIYLDSIAGKYTTSKPKAPYHLVYLGVVVKSNNGNGSIFVKVQNGYELDEIHDVQINSVANGQILVYSDTLKVWKNRAASSLVNPDSMGLRYTGTTTRNFVSIGAGNVSGYAAGTAVNGRNIAVGDSALRSNTAGVYNIGIGFRALQLVNGANNNFGYNTVVGNGSAALLQSNSSGNSVLGSRALALGISVIEATAIGEQSLGQTTASSNTALGYASGYNITSGAYNLAIGRQTMGQAYSSTTGSNNTVIGNNTAVRITSGANNTILANNGGTISVANLNSGSFNTLIGVNAENTLTTGSNNIVLAAGSSVDFLTNTGADQLHIITNNVNRFSKFTGNNFLINASGAAVTTATASAALEINGTTGSVLLPRLNTTQTNALTPVAGMVHYNSDSSRLVAYNGSSWKGLAFTDAGGGGITTIGTISGTGNANGLSISGSTLTAHPATATTAGMVTTGAQTFSGSKTFTDQMYINSGANIYGSLRGGGNYFEIESSGTRELHLNRSNTTPVYISNTNSFSQTLNTLTATTFSGNVGIGAGYIFRLDYPSLSAGKFQIAANGQTHLQDIVAAAPTISAGTLFQLESTTRGFLPPRLTATQRNAIATPAAGLMVYDTDSSRYMLYGSSWKGLAYTDAAGGGGGGSTTSASGTGISLVNGSSLVKRLKAGFNTIVTDNTDSVTISRDTLTQTLTDGATVTYDATAGVSARVTLAGNRTLSITNMNNGMYLTLVVIQDGTGGRTLTLPAGTRVVNGGAGAVTLSSAINAQDILTFFKINDLLYCNVGRNYN
jgi:hypothetical protein